MGEKEFEVILNSIHEGLAAVDREGRLTLFNQAAEQITGIKRRKALGKRAEKVIPNTRLHFVLQTGKAELNRQQQIGDVTIITNRVPVRNENGDVVGAVAVFRDISDVVYLAEQVTSLKETQTLLQSIIDSTQDAISVVDDQGMGILINPAYTRITGLTEADVLNKPATVDIAEGESMHMQVLRTGQPVRGVPMKVGPHSREVLVNAAPIIVGGRLTGSVAVIHDISEIRQLSKELERARWLIRRLETKYTFDDIVGTSSAIRKAVDEAETAAQTPATVVLRGESGTGKELFAHAIHHASGRAGQFIRVNCAAIPQSLLESELFGYIGGAFTGARKEGRRGYFEEAHRGTIFLDEVAEIDPLVQVKLLRVLQEREITRVGEAKAVPVDVRVLAATNADLEEHVRQGSFRQDLYYRLNVIPIFVPPLRERREDIAQLAQHLLYKINLEYGRNVISISREALHSLQEYDWPGNVRELENVLGRAIINMKFSDPVIQANHLPELDARLPQQATIADAGLVYAGETWEEVRSRFEKEMLSEVLKHTGGNKMLAARHLDISIRNLYNKLERYGLK
ncbi:MAG: sigma-54 interaction domain-containing protein [Bacillota bacterium]